MNELSESYYLKWNHFQINICSTLENLHMSEDFVDVTLYCEGSSVKAHKVILSACSPYFRNVFKEHPSCTHPVVILKGVALEDLKAILTFMYQGEVNIARHRLSEFMQTARLLQVRGLSNDLNIIDTHEIDERDIYSDDSNKDYKKTKRLYEEQILQSEGDSESPKPKLLKYESEKLINDDNTNFSDDNADIQNQNDTETFEEVNKHYLESNKKCSEQSVVKEIQNDSKVIEKSKNSSIKIDDDINLKSEDSQSSGADSFLSSSNIGGSILHRSLTGDHTVKPAESLVITPDLPLSEPPLITSIKKEPEDPLNTSEPPPLVPIKLNKHLNKLSSALKETGSTHKTLLNSLTQNNDNQILSKQAEDNLTNTLQLLKNNPQISVLSEKKNDIESGHVSTVPDILIKLVDQNPKQKIDSVGNKLLKQNINKGSTIIPNIKQLHPSPNIKTVSQCGKIQRPTIKASSSGIQDSNNSQKQYLLVAQNVNNPQSLEQILTQAQITQQSHTSLMWNCPHCKQEYHNQSALKYHVRLVHSDFTNRLCCYLCPNSFTMRESYKTHMLEAHGIRN